MRHRAAWRLGWVLLFMCPSACVDACTPALTTEDAKPFQACAADDDCMVESLDCLDGCNSVPLAKSQQARFEQRRGCWPDPRPSDCTGRRPPACVRSHCAFPPGTSPGPVASGSTGTSGTTSGCALDEPCGFAGSSCVQRCRSDGTLGPCLSPSGPADVRSDPNNCGLCGRACASSSCVQGLCACAADGDCALDEKCDQNGLCKPLADPCLDFSCPEGEVCRPFANPAPICLYVACSADGDCAPGEQCDPNSLCRASADAGFAPDAGVDGGPDAG